MLIHLCRPKVPILNRAPPLPSEGSAEGGPSGLTSVIVRPSPPRMPVILGFVFDVLLAFITATSSKDVVPTGISASFADAVTEL